jgi:hypothetical protein
MSFLSGEKNLPNLHIGNPEEIENGEHRSIRLLVERGCDGRTGLDRNP